MSLVKHLIFSLFLVVFGLMSCSENKTSTEIRSDFKKYYDQFQVEGSFVLYDQEHDTYIIYNQDQFQQGFSPASTFKICNSLIGLETGVIADQNFLIPWDSVNRQNPNWNMDHDLKTAYKNSTVWYYQELARRVGGQEMNYWLHKANYGNADTSGGIDQFWLNGGLRISPEQQINFLRQLHENALPFSQRSMDLVKSIMIEKNSLDYVLRGKTGWGGDDALMVGWYVGYIEQYDKTYYFVNCIQSNNMDHQDFGRARKEITFAILEELQLAEN